MNGARVVLLMFFSCLTLSHAGRVAIAQDATNTAAVIGSVVDHKNQPIAGATVTVGSGPSRQRLLTTDTGLFLVRLSPGTYTVYASKTGYISEQVAKEYLSVPPSEITVRTADESLKIPALHLYKPGVVAGSVVDDAKEPVAELHVRLFKAQSAGGRERFEASPMFQTNPLSGVTDDRGEYRIVGVPPGRYIVGVFTERGPAPSKPREFALPVFHPGSVDVDGAVPIAVGVDETLANVDFSVGSSARKTVSGRLVGGKPYKAFLVRLLKATGDPIRSEIEFARVAADSDGSFVFDNVPDGSFTISVVEWPRMPDGSALSSTTYMNPTGGVVMGGAGHRGEGIRLEDLTTYWTEWPLVVDKNISGLDLPLSRGSSICGRIEFDGSGSAPDRQTLEAADIWILHTDRTNTELPVAPIRADRTFCSVGLPTGKYQVRVSGRFGQWQLRSVHQSGRIVTGEPLDAGAQLVLTLSDRETRINGTVRNAKGEVVPNASVLAFPAERRLWRDSGPMPLMFRHTQADTAGAFSLQYLPDGEYQLVALTRPARQDWMLIDNLEYLSVFATAVRIESGTVRTIPLSGIEPRTR